MAAVSAARRGCSVALIERTRHVGGLPANGLGATDIQTRGATGGLFLEFVNRVNDHYVKTYGPNSPQVKAASSGYRFEPSVAEQIFKQLLAEHPRVTVMLMRQFDALPENVALDQNRLAQIRITNRDDGLMEEIRGKVFIDATYEGDLAAAAGVPYRMGREGRTEFNEPMAGKLYKQWGGAIGPGSTGFGDNSVQAYNFRLPLTRAPKNRRQIEKPSAYNREEYISLTGDIKRNYVAAPPEKDRYEMEFTGIGRIVNMVPLPNGKTDANNQHVAFISTDLPEENWPWPTASWAWRDRFAKRLRDYTLGLLWFAQNDSELPAEFRERVSEWGLAKDEYADNDNFPRQVYVREGRRIVGEYTFTAHDALPTDGKEGRPPVHRDSVTASHYALDSHAVLKREPGQVHLDGFFSHPTKPYTVPYGVIVPKNVDGLLTPVAISGTHVGFSTLRMEPCWMALGQAAGIAASLSIETKVEPRKVDVSRLQKELLRQKAVLIYYEDVPAEYPLYEAVQILGLRGLLPEWKARLNDPVSDKDAKALTAALAPGRRIKFVPGSTTRAELLALLTRAKRDN